MMEENKYPKIPVFRKGEINGVQVQILEKCPFPKKLILEQLQNSPHLKNLIPLFDGEIHKHLLLLCDNIDVGMTAAYHILETAVTEDIDEDEGDEKLDEEDEEWMFGEDLGEFLDVEELYPSPEKILRAVVISETDVDGGQCNDTGETNILSKMVMEQKPQLDFSIIPNLVLYCDGLIALSSKTIEFLTTREETTIVIVPKKSFNSDAANRLSFEADFEIIEVPSPCNEYLAKRLENLLYQENLKVRKSCDMIDTIKRLKQFRGSYFQERDLLTLTNKIIRKYCKSKKAIDHIDIERFRYQETTGLEELSKIVGVEKVKKILQEELAKNLHYEKMAAKKELPNRYPKHMAFLGNPGTCKTTMARIVAKLYGEAGITNGKFIEGGRSDLVGRFLGETSLKVKALFDRANGGVLFIDEAGSLVSNGGDSYATEALSALVQYMENNPQTVVILATYPEEMNALFLSNPGLKSRISRAILFDSYSVKELVEIFTSMAKNKGYLLEPGYENIISDYMEKIMSEETFGNGREVRKLLECIIGLVALKQKTEGYEHVDLLPLECMREAVKELLKDWKLSGKQNTIGFIPSQLGAGQ